MASKIIFFGSPVAQQLEWGIVGMGVL